MHQDQESSLAAAKPFPDDDINGSIPDRFRRIVDQHSEKTAIRTPLSQMSYAAFDAASEQVASLLIASTKDMSEPIAVLCDEGPDFYACVMGILKAGHFYVPLDPTYPEERNVNILGDTGARIVLTDMPHSKMAHRISPATCNVINIASSEPPAILKAVRARGADDPCYVIYTSGSTGKPKGVVQTHRNILHNCMCQTNAYKLTPGDRLTQLHSSSVMGAVRAAYNAFLNGATLYPFDVRTQGFGELRDWLVENRITIFHSTASLFRRFFGALPSGFVLPDLRLVILGGEAAFSGDFELYAEHCPDHCLLCTGLGSTETTTVRMALLDKSACPEAGSRLPAGYPVDGMSVHTINSDGHDVDPGEIGEIEIRSRYLSPGYWNRRALTNRAFLPAVPGDDPVVRRYRMGDMGRIMKDGCLFHAGRKDSQVKVRGFRVELGEVEAALARHPRIKSAAVTAPEGRTHERRIVAYVVPSDSDPLYGRTIRRDLAQWLPEYMLPSAFLFLQEIPLTPGGKIDYKALPPAVIERPELQTPFAEPNTENQRKLCQLWSDALGIEDVGIHDNVFELGADSLMVIHLLCMMEAYFGCRLSTTVLVENPTVAQLAKALEDELPDPREKEIVQICKGENHTPLFLLPGVGSIVSLYDITRCLPKDLPLYGLHLPGQQGIERPLKNMEDIAARLLAHMRNVQPCGPYCMAGYSVGGIMAFEIARQLKMQGEEVGLLASIDTLAIKRSQATRGLPQHFRRIIQLRPHEAARYVSSLAQQRMRIAKRKRERRRTGVSPARHLTPLQRVARATRKAFSAYDLSPLDIRMLHFRAQNRRYNAIQTSDNGWGQLATKGVEIHTFNCDHRSVLKPPFSKEIADILVAAMEPLRNETEREGTTQSVS